MLSAFVKKVCLFSFLEVYLLVRCVQTEQAWWSYVQYCLHYLPVTKLKFLKHSVRKYRHKILCPNVSAVRVNGIIDLVVDRNVYPHHHYRRRHHHHHHHYYYQLFQLVSVLKSQKRGQTVVNKCLRRGVFGFVASLLSSCFSYQNEQLLLKCNINIGSFTINGLNPEVSVDRIMCMIGGVYFKFRRSDIPSGSHFQSQEKSRCQSLFMSGPLRLIGLFNQKDTGQKTRVKFVNRHWSVKLLVILFEVRSSVLLKL